jgi:outer membrane PBP1 activator LpoA protein
MNAWITSAILALFFALLFILFAALFATSSSAQTPSSSGGSEWTTPQPSVQERLEAVEELRGGKGRSSASPVRPSPALKSSSKEPSKASGNLSAKPPSVALILPSKSSAYSGAAQAVREGFMAAAEAAQAKDSCLVIEYSDGEVVSAFQQAADAGAPVMVGPLVRDDLQKLLATPPLALTITLTQPEDEDVKLPPNFFPLTLTVESDARFLAREIFTEGREGKPVVLSNETPLMKRFADAFIDEWLRLGDAPPERVRFSVAEVATLKTRLEALSPSAMLLAVEGNDAALARAQTKSWPTYASGHIYQRQEEFEAAAFEGLQIVEISWLVTPQATRFKALPPLPSAPAIARLYALGYDAFQAAEAFVDGPPLTLSLEGATGAIRYGRKEGLVRIGQLAVFENGRLQLMETKPAETKRSEQKSTEAKPAEAKSAEAKSAETRHD